MFLFLTVLQAIVAAMLVGVILMQKSEGGGLGVGGSPSGMMSARGAADLLTRTTSVLAVLFVALSITLAVLAAAEGKVESLDQSLQRDTSAPISAPADDVPLVGDDPLAAAAAAAAEDEAPAANSDGSIPLDQ
ncbi:MAG: preprotein translocase subunit SecG [Sphingomonadales bacterium]|nr:preprotein translocase subunit SecG [Sphingomonadales bacterium]PIX66723.1 MAG: preprotein translocase subunit SecG [Sphingomonadales bacterium CG_4_10_14_3_um_filter_58_15]NCO49007.1 preprotein translocase subunit SecG [Sphingomonadales bacterium]NCP00419.1 preprotein translocase subunit SecG [Sphingomonadales bacterium]NCP26079.1 preprotein translocase subunit SecG [Sphingomonadales bacterium]